MDNLLNNKVAIITGGANGIGHHAALRFSKQGAKVIIADVDGLAAQETERDIINQGGQACCINVNLSKANECQHLIEYAKDTFGTIDILFNNAGILHFNDGDVVDLDEKAWDTTMAVNVKSVFLACKYAIPVMLQKNRGVIINTSSFVAIQGSANARTAYSASKAAVIALSRDLSARYAKNNIRVNTLCPGPTLTASFQRYLSEDSSREQEYLKSIPMQRFASVDEIVNAALFLASDNSSYMTGSTLIIDGGITSTYD